MNILIIHEIDFLKKVVFEYQILGELLSLRGHNVYAIDYEEKWFADSLISRRQEMKVARVYLDASVTLIRPAFIKIPVLSRVSAFMTHYYAIKKVIKEKKIDVIILYSVPTNGLQTVSLAKKFGVPVVFRSIDTLNQLVSNPLLSKITYLMERIVYSKVDLILPISYRLCQYVIKMGASENKVRLLPLGVDTGLFAPNLNTDGLRQKWGFDDKDKIIVFVGTLPYFSGLDVLIRRFRFVLEEVPKAKLLIVGDGVQRVELEMMISELNLQKRVIITGFQPQDKIPQFINMAAVCVLPFSIVGATKDIFPTKVIQYMACGKPVISTSLDGVMEMVKGEEQGIVYAGNRIATEVASLLKSDSRTQQLGQSALNYARQTYNYDQIIRNLESYLLEVRNENRSTSSR